MLLSRSGKEKDEHMATFIEKLVTSQQNQQSLLCVGLDPQPSMFPSTVGNTADAIVKFNRAIIEATSDIASCYKPNLGFYLPFGATGVDALLQVRRDVPDHIPVILDAKVGDIGSTSLAYAQAYFDAWGFDAVTAQPYLGYDSLQPFIEHRDRGVIVLTKTSNPGSGLLQDTLTVADQAGEPQPVSHLVASNAVSWNKHGNLGLVVGATYPAELRQIREIAPDLPFLVPGIGAQEGDLETAIQAGFDANGAGLIVNASRAISYASNGNDFQDAARAEALRLRDQIEASRTTAGAAR